MSPWCRHHVYITRLADPFKLTPVCGDKALNNARELLWNQSTKNSHGMKLTINKPKGMKGRRKGNGYESWMLRPHSKVRGLADKWRLLWNECVV